MTPRQFEELVCEHYRKKGYKTEITPLSGDYGIDVFATKGKEKLAIQNFSLPWFVAHEPELIIIKRCDKNQD